MIDMQSDATDAIRATIDELERLTAELWARRVEKDGILRSKDDLTRLKQELSDWLAWHARQQHERPVPKPGKPGRPGRPTPLPEERPAPRKRCPASGRDRDRK